MWGFFFTPNHMVSILIWHKKRQCCISPSLISYDSFLKLHCRHLFSWCFYPHCSWAPALNKATCEWCENTTPTAWHWVWWNNLFEATVIRSDSEVPGVEIRAKREEDRGDSEVKKKTWILEELEAKDTSEEGVIEYRDVKILAVKFEEVCGKHWDLRGCSFWCGNVDKLC